MNAINHILKYSLRSLILELAAKKGQNMHVNASWMSEFNASFPIVLLFIMILLREKNA